MLRKTMTDRGVAASLGVGCVLIASSIVTDLPWWVWAAWAALSAAAVVQAVRADD